MEIIKLRDFVIIVNKESQDKQIYLQDILNQIQEQQEKLDENSKEKINHIIYDNFLSDELEKKRIFDNTNCLPFQIIDYMSNLNLLNKLNSKILQNEFEKLLATAHFNLAIEENSSFDTNNIENLTDMDFSIPSDNEYKLLDENYTDFKFCNEDITPSSVIK